MNFSIDKSGPDDRAIYSFVSEQCRMEVRPDFGFNCVRWDVKIGGVMTPVLYRTVDFETNPVPTRNGHPVLFPFPNRLKYGRFTFEGREYQLPLTDNSGLHAIHGYTPRNPWRSIGVGCDSEQAWISGEFQLSKDLPGAVWPGDARIQITYRLLADRLRVEARIDAADGKPMPFGLGYHPYFTLGGDVSTWTLQCPTGCLWETEGNFPTGRKLPIPDELDFRTMRTIGAVAIDHPYGEISSTTLATLIGNKRKLTIDVDPAFRELLLFTPVHRQAIAIEPYTCTTDAANLDSRGLDCGWRVLAAGETFSASVDYCHSELQ